MSFIGTNPMVGAAPPGVFSRMRGPLAYALCVLLPLVGVLGVLRAGAALTAPVGVAVANPFDSTPASSIILRPGIFLIQIIVIVAASRFVGAILRRVGQPRVVGEMLAGLMLGPSLLGAIAPHLYASLFPFGTVRFLSALAQTGLVLFMFVVGLELELGELLSRRRETVIVSHASIMIPMLAGTALALLLYRNYAVTGTEFVTFALFLGCAMSITALPVLARILRESNLSRSGFGSNVIACAALADVSAWLIFAITVSIARDDASNTSTPLWQTVAGMAIYLFGMIVFVRPFLVWVYARWEHSEKGRHSLSADRLGVILLVVLASAAVTELLNIHAIFGAFVAGVVMPRNKLVTENIRVRLDDLLSILLLPLFFAYAGLRANIGALSSLEHWLICGAVIAVAVISKIGSCVIAGRASGMPMQSASRLGVLMNARGLMELVLLTIGLQLGIITPLLFTIMVIMALVTTIMTTPLFNFLTRRAAHRAVLQPLSPELPPEYSLTPSPTV